MEWEFFYRQLKAGKNIDETCFYFSDDEDEREHILGYLSQFEKPYWIGCCDVENGCEFATAKELVEACVFNGKSLKERWDKVIIYSIEGIDLQDWLEVCEHC